MGLVSRLRSGTAIAIMGACVALAATAGAATVHRLAVSTGTGSEGDSAFLQTAPAGSALQGEVSSAVNTSLKLPFGVLGEYDQPAGNAVFGIGVVGISTTGYGVAGAAFDDTEPSILAYPYGNGPGLEALTIASSTQPAVYAEAKGSGDGGDFFAPAQGRGVYGSSSVGVYGDATTAQQPYTGVFGTGPYGVVGMTTNASGLDGIVGFGDESTASNAATTAGVQGVGVRGFGVYGHSTSGTAVSGNSQSGDGIDAFSQTSYGLVSFAGGTSKGEPIAYLSAPTGIGVYAGGTSGNETPVLLAQDLVGGSDLIGTFVPNAASTATPYETFIVQSTTGNRSGTAFAHGSDVQISGDLYLSGKVYQSCSSFPAAPSVTPCYAVSQSSTATSAVPRSAGTATAVRSASGRDVAMFASSQSLPTVEDFGEAQLSAGRAVVALDPRFAQTMSAASPYLVFVTPEGDCRGLFIARRTPSSFEVRELGGGRSTIAFTYRIVAKPFGDESARLAAAPAEHAAQDRRTGTQRTLFLARPELAKRPAAAARNRAAARLPHRRPAITTMASGARR